MAGIAITKTKCISKRASWAINGYRETGHFHSLSYLSWLRFTRPIFTDGKSGLDVSFETWNLWGQGEVQHLCSHLGYSILPSSCPLRSKSRPLHRSFPYWCVVGLYVFHKYDYLSLEPRFVWQRRETGRLALVISTHVATKGW